MGRFFADEDFDAEIDALLRSRRRGGGGIEDTTEAAVFPALI